MDVPGLLVGEKTDELSAFRLAAEIASPFSASEWPVRALAARAGTHALMSHWRLLANVPLPGRPFRGENVLVPSGDAVSLCSVEGVY